MRSQREIIVVGAGVIGCSIAWRTARAGHRVTILDPDPHASASWVAGGMLAPIAEAWPGDEEALRLGLDSIERWPRFAAELAEDGHDPLLRTEGTLLTGVDTADREVLDTLAGYLDHLGHPVEKLTGSRLRRMEPLLGPAVRGGLHMPGDLAVDNRALLRGLLAAATEHGAAHVPERVTEIGARRVRTEQGTVFEADSVVLAAGAWSARLHPELAETVRPIKGEVLRLRARRGSLPPQGKTVRGIVHGRPVYLVPRADGEIVLGATQYEAGFDTAPALGGVRDLIADAETLAPSLADYELTEVCAGVRAGSVDNAPVLGALSDGVIAAAGHHRNGLLLAPLTADRITEMFLEELV
ncbi:glycine oxidase ThiO [Sciscionella sediminilitoris]|uniref:glycine oxidase ThiO n=1 Tax=Sciscionella sediminilitoris TaxID=1445613 RepID=UPI00056B321B|nr:glycine oxidase ThiO [Sciscionella sp. SE31]